MEPSGLSGKRGRTSDEENLPEKKPKTQKRLSFIKIMRFSPADVDAIPGEVRDWLTYYKENERTRHFARAALLNLILEACGVVFPIKREMVILLYPITGSKLKENGPNRLHMEDVLWDMLELIKNKMKDSETLQKEYEHLEKNLRSFFDCLVTQAQDEPVFNEILEDCQKYTIRLSCNLPSTHNKSVIWMALQLVTSLITVANKLKVERQINERQIEWIEQKLILFYNGFFLRIYKDNDPHIRASCLKELRLWILSYPSIFLKDGYLEPLKGTLKDQVSLKLDQGACSSENIVLKLKNEFTTKFYSRISKIADIRSSADVCAIGLCEHLLRHHSLRPSVTDPLYDMLIDDPTNIRPTVGNIIYDHLVSQGDVNTTDQQLLRMLGILKEFSEDPFLIHYVINDVWNRMDVMKDWECIISMLLKNTDLPNEDITVLVKLLCASVKKAVGESIVPATDIPSDSINDKEQINENRRKITHALLKNGNYLSLLQKFEDDEAKISSVIDILPHMNHEEWSKSNNKQGFQEVHKLIQRAFRKHNGKPLLRVCAMTYRWYLKNCEEGSLRQTAFETLKELRIEVVANLTSADGVYEEHSLRRLSALQNSGDVAIGSLYEDFIKKIVSTLETYKEQDSEMISLMLDNVHLPLQRSLQTVLKTGNVTEKSKRLILSKWKPLSQLLESFVTRCQLEGNNWNELGTKVGTMGAKLWTLCKKVEKLGYPLNASDFQKFWELCVQQLSISDEVNNLRNRDSLMLNAASLALGLDELKPQIYDFVTSGRSKIANHLMSFLSNTDENITKICLKALKKIYQRHLDEVSSTCDESVHLLDSKELAAQLSRIPISTSDMKEMVKMINDGITYGFVNAPRQLSFLDGVVLHFVSKLPLPEIVQIYSSVGLQKENADMDKDPSGWLPYRTFIEALKILTLGE